MRAPVRFPYEFFGRVCSSREIHTLLYIHYRHHTHQHKSQKGRLVGDIGVPLVGISRSYTLAPSTPCGEREKEEDTGRNPRGLVEFRAERDKPVPNGLGQCHHARRRRKRASDCFFLPSSISAVLLAATREQMTRASAGGALWYTL